MSPGNIDSKVVAQRVFWISQMTDALKDLRLEWKVAFLADRHKIAAAESYLRHALEALFDIGRHILAKKFAYPATEYKEIAKGLSENRVLVEKEAELMRKVAGYRNRMVYFYHEISPEELHEICFFHAEESKFLVEKKLQWTREQGNSIS